ncbi:MAG: class I SAM-dependent methyltransferase [Proteobacteria bacterium]|nr:class I SAM-dependent methyltransferase [Pseudomonadota bacterium]
MVEVALPALLQCPRCRRAPLVPDEAALACRACRVQFPRVGGVPWLFADPDLSLGDWRNRLTLYLEDFAAAARLAEIELSGARRAPTRARLSLLREAYLEQARLVRELLAPLAMPALPLPHATQLAVGSALPLSQDLHSYYANVHRDWCWGGEENQAALAQVGPAVGAAERVLVLGAGAGRLAYDLHQTGASRLTVALDINPLLVLAAERVVRGVPVELYEFPIAPLRTEDVAVRRRLVAPAPARAGLELVFADAWRAPFAPQSFEAVVTPWLIDIVDEDLEQIASAVNRLLVPGGRWVNFGSLAFPWRNPARRLGPDEVREVATEAGFEVTLQRDAALPYMRSPVSRHARTETVALLAAEKRRRAPREDGGDAAQPAWLRDTALPVPRTEALALAADASRIQAVLLALVDGKRSIDELTRIVAEQRLLPPAQARSAVQGLLERLLRSAERIERA